MQIWELPTIDAPCIDELSNDSHTIVIAVNLKKDDCQTKIQEIKSWAENNAKGSNVMLIAIKEEKQKKELRELTENQLNDSDSNTVENEEKSLVCIESLATKIHQNPIVQQANKKQYEDHITPIETYQFTFGDNSRKTSNSFFTPTKVAAAVSVASGLVAATLVGLAVASIITPVFAIVLPVIALSVLCVGAFFLALKLHNDSEHPSKETPKVTGLIGG